MQNKKSFPEELISSRNLIEDVSGRGSWFSMSDYNENLIPTCILRLLSSTYHQTSKLYALATQNEKAGVKSGPLAPVFYAPQHRHHTIPLERPDQEESFATNSTNNTNDPSLLLHSAFDPRLAAVQCGQACLTVHPPKRSNDLPHLTERQASPHCEAAEPEWPVNRGQ